MTLLTGYPMTRRLVKKMQFSQDFLKFTDAIHMREENGHSSGTNEARNMIHVSSESLDCQLTGNVLEKIIDPF